MNHIVNNFNGSRKANKNISEPQVLFYAQDFDGPVFAETDEDAELAFSKPSAIAVEHRHSTQRYNQNSEYIYHDNWNTKTTYGKKPVFKSKEATSLLLQAYFSNNSAYRFKCHTDEEKTNMTVLYISGAQYCAFQLTLSQQSLEEDCKVNKVLVDGNPALFSQLEQEINDAMHKDSALDFCDDFGDILNSSTSNNKEFYMQHIASIDYQLQIMTTFAPFGNDWMDALQIICDLVADAQLLQLLQSRGAVFALANALTVLLTDVSAGAQVAVSGAEWRQILCCTLQALSSMMVHTSSLMDVLSCEPLVRVLMHFSDNTKKAEDCENQWLLDPASALIQEHTHQCSAKILSALRAAYKSSPTLWESHPSVAQILELTH